jgi:hypothetical protein
MSAKKKGLSDEEVLKLVDGRANLVLYEDIANYDSVDDLLYPYGACIILYEMQVNPSIYGHWVLLHKRGKELDYFDSYGETIDNPLDFVPKNIRKKTNQDFAHLSQLILDSGYRTQYNDHQFQEFNPNIRTCGRYVALRLLLKDLSLKKFEKMFKGKNPDDTVVKLTEWINQ